MGEGEKEELDIIFNFHSAHAETASGLMSKD